MQIFGKTLTEKLPPHATAIEAAPVSTINLMDLYHQHVMFYFIVIYIYIFIVLFFCFCFEFYLYPAILTTA